MESVMNEEFTEEKIHEKLWDYLSKLYEQDCLAKNWRGWSYRVGKEQREKTFFYREFDIARFHREQLQYTTNLWLYGYEVKGYGKIIRKSKGESKITYEEPAFGLGIEQALVLLYQGADFAYLVIPEPKKERDKNNLQDFCEKYARYIGLMFLTEQGTFWEFRKAERNTLATDDRKKKMLTSLISGGQVNDIKIPVWCKKQEF
jgi:hypothetical protein